MAQKKDLELRAGQHPQHALAATLLPAEPDEVLELDELWSFVGSKENVVWLWVVLCRRTRQVVAWMWGDRTENTCQDLWAKVPASYKGAFCYSDLLAAYQKVLDKDHHRACLKQEGQTNHIERFNLTLRQRMARLVRKTLSFSKSLFMHILSIRLFLHSYNLEQAHKYNKSCPI